MEVRGAGGVGAAGREASALRRVEARRRPAVPEWRSLAGGGGGGLWLRLLMDRERYEWFGDRICIIDSLVRSTRMDYKLKIPITNR